MSVQHGAVGVLADDGERVQCHICGRWFSHLGSHVRQGHGVEPSDYRREFGLCQATGLVGPALAEKMRERCGPLLESAKPRNEAIRRGDVVLKPYGPRDVTPEERLKRSEIVRGLVDAGWRPPGGYARVRAAHERLVELRQDPVWRKAQAEKMREGRWGRRA